MSELYDLILDYDPLKIEDSEDDEPSYGRGDGCDQCGIMFVRKSFWDSPNYTFCLYCGSWCEDCLTPVPFFKHNEWKYIISGEYRNRLKTRVNLILGTVYCTSADLCLLVCDYIDFREIQSVDRTRYEEQYVLYTAELSRWREIELPDGDTRNSVICAPCDNHIKNHYTEVLNKICELKSDVHIVFAYLDWEEMVISDFVWNNQRVHVSCKICKKEKARQRWYVKNCGTSICCNQCITTGGMLRRSIRAFSKLLPRPNYPVQFVNSERGKIVDTIANYIER